MVLPGRWLIILLCGLSLCTVHALAAGAAPLKGYGLSPIGFPSDFSRLQQFFRNIGQLGTPRSEPAGGIGPEGRDAPEGSFGFKGTGWAESGGGGGGTDKNGEGGATAEVSGGVLEVVYANTAWRDSESTSGQVPSVMHLVQSECSVRPRHPRCHVSVEFGWRSGSQLLLSVPSNPVNNWSNEQAADLYIEAVVEYVTKYASREPLFVFLGNENNFYFQENATDYKNWIQVYNRAYAAAKAANPNCTIGPTFNFESMSGNGVLNGWRATQWGALTAHDFSRVDVLGLTSYPMFNFTAADQYPPNYFESLFQQLSCCTNAPLDANGLFPLALTETGWPQKQLSSTVFPWAESTEDASTYVQRLFASSPFAHEKVALVQWLFLNSMSPSGVEDSMEYKEFGSIAMQDEAGNPYPSLALWQGA